MSFIEYFAKKKEGSNERYPEYTIRKGRVAGAIAGAALAMSMLTCGWTTVPAGHVGVRTRFGSVQKEEFASGFHVKNPIERVRPMTTRTREVQESMKVPTSAGLIAGLDVSLLYHLDGTRADSVYDNLGDDAAYETNIVKPLIRSTTRDVVAGYRAEDLYSTARGQVRADIIARLAPEFQRRGFVLEDALIRDLTLPPSLTKAIEDKMSEEQKKLTMTYTIDRERQIAEQRRIEAQGIADAQRIISSSLTNAYLTWNHMETLEKFANSPNNTVIVMPYDSKLTPMLNVPSAPAAPAAAPRRP